MSPNRLLLPLVAIMLSTSLVTADDARSTPAALKWQSDYGTAYAAAKEQQRMLLIYFEGSPDDASAKEIEATLAKANIQELCRDYELLRIPAAYEVTVNGETTQLLAHKSFSALGKKSGLAIVDLKHADRDHYLQTVSALPFGSRVYYALH